jgi:hypothetical protein
VQKRLKILSHYLQTFKNYSLQSVENAPFLRYYIKDVKSDVPNANVPNDRVPNLEKQQRAKTSLCQCYKVEPSKG